jgi:hypothetical protein
VKARALLVVLPLTAYVQESAAQATHPFTPIQQVLQSPRCMNCHPSGNAPLQTDASRPHKMNITRDYPNLGGSCQTCHQDAPMPGDHMPPGAPHWGLPPAIMVFQGKSPTQLCVDLKDTSKNGNRSLADLQNHVSTDALVLWGFNPGGNRTTPPLNHTDFVARFSDWVALGGPCP